VVATVLALLVMAGFMGGCDQTHPDLFGSVVFALWVVCLARVVAS
jgi:hypothetical protein